MILTTMNTPGPGDAGMGHLGPIGTLERAKILAPLAHFDTNIGKEIFISIFNYPRESKTFHTATIRRLRNTSSDRDLNTSKDNIQRWHPRAQNPSSAGKRKIAS